MTRLLLLLALAPVALVAEPAPMPRPAGPVTFADVVNAAAADAKSLPPGESALTRYLEAKHLSAEDRRELYKVVSYHVNGLSRESKRAAPRQVTPWLWAVRLDHYRWSPETWKKLAEKNVYYTVKAKVTVPGPVVTKQRQVLRSGYYVTESYTEAGPVVEREEVIVGPWLPPVPAAELVSLTGSRTPVVRADQFLHLTFAQVDRAGHGYYDWLGLKNRADAEHLAALDRAKAAALYRELAAIIPVSGVTPQNRQVFRYATITGAWWESRDAKTSVGGQNAHRNLLEQYKHDAEEVVFTLPNGLPGYYLSDAAGKQVDAAPDFIAADHRATNNDRRVHVGYSCAACHQDAGLKPVRDYARKVYGNPDKTGVSLAPTALDPARARRLESVYLGPLERAYARDVADYAEAVADLTKLTGPDLSRAVERQWGRYLDDPVTLGRAAAECGVTPAELQVALRRHVRSRGGAADLVLAAFLMDDGPPIRREHHEEAFALLMLTLGGGAP
ncbi:hypothetical protein J0H58_35125 [bacterium]|nr:hypothetical protein [bacterium]